MNRFFLYEQQVGKLESGPVMWRGDQVSSVKDKCRGCSSVRRIKEAGTDRVRGTGIAETLRGVKIIGNASY